MKKRNFVWAVLLLAFPNIMQQLVTNLASLIDNLMVGGLAEHAIAGVTITNQVVFIVTIVFFGIGGTAGIFIPQYMGAKNLVKANESIKLSIIISFIVGLLFFIVTSLFPEAVLGVFATEAETIAQGKIFLNYIRFTFLMLPISLALGSGFRFTGHVKLPMYVAFVTVGLGTLLNFALIHGNLGFPALGVAGAGLGTLIARSAELVILIVLSLMIDSPVKMKLATFFTVDKTLLLLYFQKGYGLVLNELFWATGMQMMTIIYTSRISENIAAMSIANTFGNLIWIGMGGMSTVFSIYIGEHLGANDFDAAKRDAKALQKIAAVLGFSIALVVLVLSFFLMGIFDVSPHVMATGRRLLMITVMFSWLGYSNGSNYFILRSGGDTKSVLIIDSLFTWIINIPAAFLIGLFGPTIVLHVLLMQSFECLKLIVGWRMVKKEKWLNNLTEEPETEIVVA